MYTTLWFDFEYGCIKTCPSHPSSRLFVCLPFFFFLLQSILGRIFLSTFHLNCYSYVVDRYWTQTEYQLFMVLIWNWVSRTQTIWSNLLLITVGNKEKQRKQRSVFFFFLCALCYAEIGSVLRFSSSIKLPSSIIY